MKHFLLLVTAVWIVIAGSAQTGPKWQWAATAGGKGLDYGSGVVTDAWGNSYITGAIHDTAHFGMITVSLKEVGIYLAKYLPDGSLAWVKTVCHSDGGTLFPAGLCMDAAGQLMIAGTFGQKTFFGQDSLDAGIAQIFLAKYDTAGNELWVKRAAYDQYAFIEFGLTTDGAGNIFIGSRCADGINVGGTTLLEASLFVSKFSPGGSLIWVRPVKGNMWLDLNDLATDRWGNVFATGVFKDTARFGSSVLTTVDHTYDIFLVKYDRDGVLQWARQAGGTNDNELGLTLAADDAGNVLVGGRAGDSAYFGTEMLRTWGESDIFIAKYDSAGTVLWVKTARGSGGQAGYELPFALTTDALGSTYVTGSFEDSIYFGNILLTNGLGGNVFVTKLDASGNAIWAVSPANSMAQSGPNDGVGSGICLDKNGDILVTGLYAGHKAFGAVGLTSSGDDDLFLARLAPPTGVRQVAVPGRTALVWPNPASGAVSLVYSNAFSTLDVFDALGRRVVVQPLSMSGKDELRLEQVPDGRYWLRFTGKESTAVRSVVVKH